MAIEFDFEIVSVQPEYKTMEVVYTSPGLRTHRMSVRLPTVGESTDDVIRAHAPIPLWELESVEVVVPEVGYHGRVRSVVPQMNDALQPQPLPTINLDPL